MNRVRIQEKIKDNGAKIDTLNEDFKSNINELLTCFESINAAWESPNSQKYVSMLADDYINDLKKLSDSIESYSNFIKHVHPTYEDVEQKYKSIVDGIGV